MGKPLLRRFYLLLRLLLLLYALAALFLWQFQEHLIYHPRSYEPRELEKLSHAGGSELEYVTSQGRQVAFYLPSREGSANPPFLWLVFAGKASLSLDFCGYVRGWDPRFAYLFIDYPGYGLCEGRPSPEHIAENIAAVTSQLRNELHWSPHDFQRRTGVLGHSLGCAAALIAATQQHVSRVVLCAPFPSMDIMAARRVGWPLCLLNRHCFDNTARLNELSQTGAHVCIFHGTEDRTIPIELGRRLAAPFPEFVQFIPVKGSSHGGLLPDAQQEIGARMRGFSIQPGAAF